MVTAALTPARSPSAALTRALLACGIAYAAVYVFANDVIAASLYAGYSRVDQAVSELSATHAPTQPFLLAMLPVFTLLMAGFGVGVWRAAAGRPALRTTGALIVVGAVLGVTWIWFPMTTREQMGAGPMPANDVGHLVLSGLTVLFILLEMGFSAAALGRGFRLFTALCAAAMLGFGGWMSALSTQVSSGPTPWLGLVERVMLGGWLGWMMVLAAALLRGQGAPAKA